MPSGCTVFSTPNCDSPSAMLAIRSLSFTRSSSAPRSTVVPSAQAAAINTAGNSSIASGTASTGISIPFKGAWRTRRSATGSPPTLRSFAISMSAPIARKIVMTPSRVGFIPTCSRVRSEPGAMEAPTIKKAADEMSAGISISVPLSDPPPSRQIRSSSTATS